MPDRYDEIEHELLGVPLPGGVAVAPPAAPGAPMRDRFAEIEAELGLTSASTFDDFERLYGDGPGPVAAGGVGGVEVTSPDAVRGAGPRALRDTGPDVVPAVTDLSRWRGGAPPVQALADPLGSMLAASKMSPGVTAAIRAAHPAPLIPARDDGRTFTPARVPSSLDTDAPLDVETKARLMRRLYPGRDVDPGSEVLSPDERERVFREVRGEFPGLMGFERRAWSDGIEEILADRMSAAAFDRVFGSRTRRDLADIEAIVARHEPDPATFGERAQLVGGAFVRGANAPAAGIARRMFGAGGPLESPDALAAAENVADPARVSLGDRYAKVRADVESTFGGRALAGGAEMVGNLAGYSGSARALADPRGFGRIVPGVAAGPTAIGLQSGASAGGSVEGFGSGVAFGGLAGAFSVPVQKFIMRLPVGLRSAAADRLLVMTGGGAEFAAADALLNGADGERALLNAIFGAGTKALGPTPRAAALAHLEASKPGEVRIDPVRAAGETRAEFDRRLAEVESSRPEAPTMDPVAAAREVRAEFDARPGEAKSADVVPFRDRFAEIEAELADLPPSPKVEGVTANPEVARALEAVAVGSKVDLVVRTGEVVEGVVAGVGPDRLVVRAADGRMSLVRREAIVDGVVTPGEAAPEAPAPAPVEASEGPSRASATPQGAEVVPSGAVAPGAAAGGGEARPVVEAATVPAPVAEGAPTMPATGGGTTGEGAILGRTSRGEVIVELNGRPYVRQGGKLTPAHPEAVREARARGDVPPADEVVAGLAEGDVVTLRSRHGMAYEGAKVVKVTPRRLLVELANGDRQNLRRDTLTEARVDRKAAEAPKGSDEPTEAEIREANRMIEEALGAIRARRRERPMRGDTGAATPGRVAATVLNPRAWIRGAQRAQEMAAAWVGERIKAGVASVVDLPSVEARLSRHFGGRDYRARADEVLLERRAASTEARDAYRSLRVEGKPAEVATGYFDGSGPTLADVQATYGEAYAKRLKRFTDEKVRNHRELVDLGLVEKGADEAMRGGVGYALRLYDSVLRGEAESDLAPIARGKHLPENPSREALTEADRIALGEIRDPAIIVSATIAKQRSLLAYATYLRDVARNPLWSNTSGGDGWVKVPPAPRRYGALAGRYVRPWLLRDLDTRMGPRVASDSFASFIDGLVADWKYSVSGLRPAALGRDTAGNILFAEVAGLSVTDPTTWPSMAGAVRLLRSEPGSALYEVKTRLRRAGLLETSAFDVDVLKMLDEVQAAPGRNAWESLSNYAASKWKALKRGQVASALPVVDLVAKLKGLQDGFFRAWYVDSRLAAGDSLRDAIDATKQAFPHYAGNVSARMQRGGGLFGATARALALPPFTNFLEWSARWAARTVATQPATTAAVLGGLSALTRAVQAANGVDDREMEDARRVLSFNEVPSMIRPLVGWGKHGPKVLDLAFVLPLANEAESLLHAVAGDDRGDDPRILPVGPFGSIAVQLLLNRSAFTGHDVAPEHLPDAMQSERRWKFALQGVFPLARDVERFVDAMNGVPRDAKGRTVPDKTLATVDAFLGIKVRDADVPLSRAFRLSAVAARLDKLTSDLLSTRDDARLDEDERAERLRALAAEALAVYADSLPIRAGLPVPDAPPGDPARAAKSAKAAAKAAWEVLGGGPAGRR